MLEQPWWNLWPGRLELELAELEATGVPFERDEEAWRRGVLVLQLQRSVGGQVVHLTAVFPHLYPYFRFEVYAPELELAHHQHPFSKNLCFIGRGTENWAVDDTLAQFITRRLAIVLNAGRAREAADVDGVEQRQAEPFSNYYTYEPGAVVLVDSAWSIEAGLSDGELVIGVEPGFDGRLRGAVLEVLNPDGRVLAHADAGFARRYATKLRGRWVRALEPIRRDQPVPFLEALDGIYPGISKLRPRALEAWRVDVIGVLFPEEVEWRRNGEGWMFLVRSQPIKHRHRDRWSAHLVQAARAGRTDLWARVPETAALAGRRVALIGLGGIGAPSAFELARAGIGELRLLDHDTVQAGTVVRWPLGMPAIGRLKAEEVVSFIAVHYPYTQVRGWAHKIGGIPGRGPSDMEVLQEVLAAVDLVYDCSAEVGVHHCLADLCRRLKIPYVAVSTTPGAWGARVVRFRPAQTEGCWACYVRAEAEGALPSPPGDPRGTVQPHGCADPTFTGTGFDVSTVALIGVRLVVGTLSGTSGDVYPDVDWDVAVIALRDKNGQVMPVRQETFRLSRHPQCLCGGR